LIRFGAAACQEQWLAVLHAHHQIDLDAVVRVFLVGVPIAVFSAKLAA
jgi:hypothetical protein